MRPVVSFICWWTGGLCIGILVGACIEHSLERPEREQLHTVIYYVSELAEKYDKEHKPAEALAIRKAIRGGLDRGGEKATELPRVERLLMKDMSRDEAENK